MAGRIEGLRREDALVTPFLALGTHDQIADHLLASRSRWGISYYSVRDIDAFAPVIERLRATGAAERCPGWVLSPLDGIGVGALRGSDPGR